MIFRNELYFLSNFYPCDVEFEGLKFKCSEAAFQAAKSLDPKVREKFCNLKGGEAKSLGRKIKLREDWEEVKIQIMIKVVYAKFKQNTNLLKRLKEVKGYISEDTTWDNFWGLKYGKGDNYLGRILMNLRDKMELPQNNHGLSNKLGVKCNSCKYKGIYMCTSTEDCNK